MRKAIRNRRNWSTLIVLTTLAFAQPGFGLVISEIMYHPIEDSAGEESLEFIELYNNRAVSEYLGGWSFTNGIEYTFEPNTVLGPKSYLVIAKDPNALMALYGITDILGPYNGRLNNDGERIELSTPAGMRVLSLRYNDASPWPVSPDGAGHSLILAKYAGDPELASSWSPSSYIGGTPGGPDESQASQEDSTLLTLVDIGMAGRYFKGVQEPSPGADGAATTAWTEVSFNDDPATTAWLEGPSGYGYSNDATELQYVGSRLDDMRGNYASIYARLRFTLTAGQIASLTQMMAEIYYDDAYVLYLNGVRVSDSESIAGNPPAFDTLADTQIDNVSATVDLLNQKSLLLAGENVLAIQIHNGSLSSSDCFAGIVLRATVDQLDAGDDPDARLVINELQAGSSDGTAGDRIELYNPGPSAVRLGNIYLSDDRLNLLQYGLPTGVTLQPGEFWTVSQGAPEGLPFALNASGETIYLTAATGDGQPVANRVLDAVRYGAIEPDVTFGRYPDGADSMDCLATATFGQPNSGKRIRDVVINEIMYHHATRDERYEYVELYNKGASPVSLAGWAFTDGIDYTFSEGAAIPPGGYLVVAQDPNFLAAVYDNLTLGANLVGPYQGGLDDRSERIRLSRPQSPDDPLDQDMITVDEVTYFDGGRWPAWADGLGASLELRDPNSDNDTPGAWADSDESDKTQWTQFTYTIDAGDSRYTHDAPSVFDMMLLTAGEVLLDDLECVVDGVNRLDNNGFENGEASWRILGSHVRSFVTTKDAHSGSNALHLIATGHGDPGANRINQSIGGAGAGSVTFRGWARWVRGSRFLLLRTTRELSPVRPPRPAHAFELPMPLNLGTPGRQNSAFIPNRGPDILDVRHDPVLPTGSTPIVITARVLDDSGVAAVTLHHRSEGSTDFASLTMADDGSGNDAIAGDRVYTATITGATTGSMRAFYIEASDGASTARFPTRLESSAEAPERTCLIRVGDTKIASQLANYRIWMSNDVVNAFRSRPSLSNELLDCTFIYNDTEIFYNCGIRLRGSPFIRPGAGDAPQDRLGMRIEFRPDQSFRGRQEINLDATEGTSRGPLQERASYWVYAQMGMQYSRQEWVRLFVNGTSLTRYDDVQKIDGDYIDAWFPGNNEGYIHKIDDYFEYNVTGTSHSGEAADEGLLCDSSHPLLPDTYRWHFEKRSHPEDDAWQHLYDLAVALNTPSSSSTYEKGIESKLDPVHFTRMLALRHAVGDWDSYGYTRGKNNAFYYALPEGKWYLLPWDIDFTLGSGRGSSSSLLEVTNEFPEIVQFLAHPKYKQMYYDAFKELVEGPWKTSYGTNDPPTAFDKFLDEGADLLVAEGMGDGRRDQIKQFVRDRRIFILSQLQTGDDTPTRRD
ncbi:MAG: lamin tail domain-containing protein [Solirubrobacterales bacterium]